MANTALPSASLTTPATPTFANPILPSSTRATPATQTGSTPTSTNQTSALTTPRATIRNIIPRNLSSSNDIFKTFEHVVQKANAEAVLDLKNSVFKMLQDKTNSINKTENLRLHRPENFVMTNDEVVRQLENDADEKKKKVEVAANKKLEAERKRAEKDVSRRNKLLKKQSKIQRLELYDSVISQVIIDNISTTIETSASSLTEIEASDGFNQ